ncbi:ankyrin repeats (many copies) domain-containing protein [Ditylenchus destructor]|uniref:Ankyrin repeats (Many copies) domain-containing protein n=1 Tax=Ditylenchus destructor TaxID=166010 RepID=A0AAD4MT85_9BILA|nr:ankyrin repeats (many copies) domain-containing protein [Ditylenchus destructor]
MDYDNDYDINRQLVLVCQNGILEMAKSLVAKGADIEATPYDERTPIIWASGQGRIEVVRYLISIGANVNKRGHKGATALHFAVWNGNLELVKCLIEAGAKQIPEDDGLIPIICAAKKGNGQIVSFASKHVDAQDEHDAWKLLGATIIEEENDVSTALNYWRSAFLNQKVLEGIRSGEICSSFVWNPARRQAYGPDISEIESVEDVDRLAENSDAIYMQALLIRERILGGKRTDGWFYRAILRRGSYFCDTGRWNRACDLWFHAIQLAQHYDSPMSSWIATCVRHVMAGVDDDDIWILSMEDRQRFECTSQITSKHVSLFVDRFVYEAERYLRHKHQPIEMQMGDFSEEYFKKVVQLAEEDTATLEAGIIQFLRLTGLMLEQNLDNDCYKSSNEEAEFGLTQNTFCQHANLEMGEMPPAIDLDVPLTPRCPHLRCILRRATTVFDHLGLSLLHAACARTMYFHSERLPSPSVLKQLLWANPFEANMRLWTKKHGSKGATPLHILFDCPISKDNLESAKVLLQTGVPFLVQNSEGLTCDEQLFHKICDDNCLQILQQEDSARADSLIPKFGSFITLKQIAAKQLQRQFKNEETGKTMKFLAQSLLPLDLFEFVAIFE